MINNRPLTKGEQIGWLSVASAVITSLGTTMICFGDNNPISFALGFGLVTLPVAFALYVLFFKEVIR